MASMPTVETIMPMIAERMAFIWFLAPRLVMQLRPIKDRAKYSALWNFKAMTASRGAQRSMAKAEKMLPKEEAVTANPNAMPACPFMAMG